MKISDFMGMWFSNKGKDEVLVDATELQKFVAIARDNEIKLNNLRIENEKFIKERALINEEFSELQSCNRNLLNTASKVKKLAKENEELKYKLELSNMFLERRKERDAANAYKKHIKVDLYT